MRSGSLCSRARDCLLMLVNIKLRGIQPYTCPNLFPLRFPSKGFSNLKKRHHSPRGRFVPAHLRRYPLNPSIYCRVVDYQEETDRLQSKRKRIDEPQMKLPFPAFQEEDQKAPPQS